ncbi:phage tail assembly protein [Enterobacter ludwigii]|uniref:phage tail assembly protein n=1 Tax=Enterobacter ludwigii TaxID=299767 RepID=UPI003BEF0EC7
MEFTHSGVLPFGVLYNGQLHREFTVRLATIGDEIAALEDGVSDAGLSTAIMARVLEKLGDIPPDDITYELLCDHLLPDDYNALADARKEVKKKLSEWKPDSTTIASPSSGSDDTATAKAASGGLAL